jgi:hypothetical protein
MGLSMSEREAVTKTIATRYRRADKAGERRTSTSCARPQAGIVTMPVRRCGGCCGRRSQAQGSAATEVRAESRCGADLLLGGTGYAGGQAASPDPAGVGADRARVRRAGRRLTPENLSRRQLHTGQRTGLVTLGRSDDGLDAAALLPDVWP